MVTRCTSSGPHTLPWRLPLTLTCTDWPAPVVAPLPPQQRPGRRFRPHRRRGEPTYGIGPRVTPRTTQHAARPLPPPLADRTGTPQGYIVTNDEATAYSPLRRHAVPLLPRRCHLRAATIRTTATARPWSEIRLCTCPQARSLQFVNWARGCPYAPPQLLEGSGGHPSTSMHPRSSPTVRFPSTAAYPDRTDPSTAAYTPKTPVHRHLELRVPLVSAPPRLPRRLKYARHTVHLTTSPSHPSMHTSPLRRRSRRLQAVPATPWNTPRGRRNACTVAPATMSPTPRQLHAPPVYPEQPLPVLP